MPAMVIAAFVFVPYFWRSGVFTIPEFLGRRYNTAVQEYNTAIRRLPTVILARLLGYEAKQPFAAEAEAQKAPKVQFR